MLLYISCYGGCLELLRISVDFLCLYQNDHLFFQTKEEDSKNSSVCQDEAQKRYLTCISSTILTMVLVLSSMVCFCPYSVTVYCDITCKCFPC